jgi:hypothetical protein
MFKTGDYIKNINPSCTHYGSAGLVLNSTDIETEYIVFNTGATFKEYDVLTKSNDQLQNINNDDQQTEAWHTSKMYSTPSETDALKNKMTVKFGKDADTRYNKMVAASRNNVDLAKKMHSPIYTGPEKQMLLKKLRTLTKDTGAYDNTEMQSTDEEKQEFLNIFKEEIKMAKLDAMITDLYEEYNRLLKVHSYILTKEETDLTLKKQGLIETKLEAIENTITEKLKSNSSQLNENKYGEGWMIKSQLYNIVKSAASLYDMVNEEEDFEDWIQYKITLAEDYILTAAKFIEFRKSQEGSFYSDDKSHYNE